MTTPSEIEITLGGNGWKVEIDGLTIIAQSPRLDRGSIRAALTVRKEEAVLWTQKRQLDQ